MLQAALALAAALGSTPTGDPPSLPPVQFAPPQGACGASLDPSFVRYVPPPRRDARNPLLWLIGAPSPFGFSAGHPLAFSPVPGCVRLLQVKDGR